MIRQHEVLRVPQGWTEQDKAFVIQLSRIFDDIYKQYGRLEWDDLGEKLREYLTNIHDGTVTAVTWDGTNQKLTVTIGGSARDVVTISTIKTALELTKSDVGLGNVENKSVSEIKSALGSFTWGALAGRS